MDKDSFLKTIASDEDAFPDTKRAVGIVTDLLGNSNPNTISYLEIGRLPTAAQNNQTSMDIDSGFKFNRDFGSVMKGGGQKVNIIIGARPSPLMRNNHIPINNFLKEDYFEKRNEDEKVIFFHQIPNQLVATSDHLWCYIGFPNQRRRNDNWNSRSSYVNFVNIEEYQTSVLDKILNAACTISEQPFKQYIPKISRQWASFKENGSIFAKVPITQSVVMNLSRQLDRYNFESGWDDFIFHSYL
jgi:hypothetical protein